MCGRYSLAGPNPAQVRAAYPALESVEVARRFNVAPGDDVAAVTTSREGAARGELLRWGLVPSWSESPQTAAKMINARVETVSEKPAYRRAFQSMRCLIPADGFYEWQRRSSGPKQAFHITAVGREVFAFAGLWSIWHAPDGGTLRSCTILTTEANAAVAELHDRMPIILRRENEAEWIDPGTPAPRLFDLLTGLTPDETAVRPVGPAVNDARYDGPECLADAAPEQATLF
jgi:putative SOS response-associated peptidase YedK